MNITMKGYFKVCKPQLLLEFWFNCWANKDPQFYQDVEWDWEFQLGKFIKDPVGMTIIAVKQNPEICFCCGELKDPETLSQIKKGGH